MSYTLQVFQERHLEFKQNENISLLLRKCEICQTEFSVKRKLSNQRFCSIQCAGKAKRVDHVCVGCGIIFQNPTVRHMNRVNPKYCNRECYNKTGSNFRYKNFYYCDHCEEWIPHKDAIIYNNWPCCNRCAQYAHFHGIPHKLKTSAKNSKWNRIRKQVKYIE